MNITINTGNIAQHGAEWACMVELIQNHRLQTIEQLAVAMGCTERYIDNQLTAMNSKKLIDYVSNARGQKRAFVI